MYIMLTVQEFIASTVEMAKKVCEEEGIDYQEFIEAIDRIIPE